MTGVANDLEVRLPTGSERPDPEISRDAVAALKNELPHSSENMKVLVNNGWITLEGTAEWNYQRTRAEEAVQKSQGNQRRNQSHCADASRRALGNQGQDRGRLSPQRGA